MKNRVLPYFLFLICGIFASDLYADTRHPIIFEQITETTLTINNLSEDGFSGNSLIKTIEMTAYESPEGEFVRLGIDGYTKNYLREGQPHLPVKTKLVEIPDGASVRVNILNYETEEIFLDEKYNGLKIGPMQPSFSKNISPDEVAFKFDRAAYNTDKYNTDEPVLFEVIGGARGVQFGKLIISPFCYNPVKNALRVLNNLAFEVIYETAATVSKKRIRKRKYSPAFSGILSSVEKLPATVSGKKDILTAGVTGPLTYAIVAHDEFRDDENLNEFIAWKQTCGFNVITGYTGDAAVGSTRTSIKAYLEALYNSSTSPSYVLFIGDVDQIPAWDGRTGSHVTDLYYFTYDGSSDYIPDVYYGRFSAESSYELASIISKTLQYEKFEFSLATISNYLDEYLFVAGDDDNFAETHGNAQVNYAVSEYFPTDNKYLYTEGRPSISNEIKALIDKGMGFVNFTGHCNYSGWSKRDLSEFYLRSSDVQNMQNSEKYGFMIGNCCLSSKFDEDDSFGEMLLKQRNAGSIGYIGASNDTFWDEDIYWAIGKTSLNINVPANADQHTSDNTETGAYDGMFSTEDDESEMYGTAGQIVYRGNLSVTETGSNRDRYYWEVYNLMGDPALTPYLSDPDTKNGNGETQNSEQDEEGAGLCFIGSVSCAF